MTKENLTQLTPINKQNLINFIEKDGKILFSSEEIGKQLGYATPAKSINKLFQRNSLELLNYSVDVKLTSTDGKAYNKRHFTEEGVYILSMLANTDKAREFRSRLAKLLKELREEKELVIYQKGVNIGKSMLAVEIERTHEIAYQQGIDYAKSLPALEIETKKSYLQGLEEGKKLQKDTWQKMEKAIDLLAKGLPLSDTAKLVGLHSCTIRRRFQRLGLWEQVKNGDLWYNMPHRAIIVNKEKTAPEQLSLI